MASYYVLFQLIGFCRTINFRSKFKFNFNQSWWRKPGKIRKIYQNKNFRRILRQKLIQTERRNFRKILRCLVDLKESGNFLGEYKIIKFFIFIISKKFQKISKN